MLKLKTLVATAVFLFAAVAAASAAEHTIQRAMLGVKIVPAVSADVSAFARHGTSEGVHIADVMRGGPGDLAGLKAGDIVIKLNGAPVQGMLDLQRRVSESLLGDSFRLIVLRNGEERVIDGVFNAWTPACQGKRRKADASD